MAQRAQGPEGILGPAQISGFPCPNAPAASAQTVAGRTASRLGIQAGGCRRRRAAVVVAANCPSTSQGALGTSPGPGGLGEEAGFPGVTGLAVSWRLAA